MLNLNLHVNWFADWDAKRFVGLADACQTQMRAEAQIMNTSHRCQADPSDRGKELFCPLQQHTSCRADSLIMQTSRLQRVLAYLAEPEVWTCPEEVAEPCLCSGHSTEHASPKLLMDPTQYLLQMRGAQSHCGSLRGFWPATGRLTCSGVAQGWRGWVHA